MKTHSAHGDAKTVKSAVKSIFVRDILLLMCQMQSKFPGPHLSSSEGICLLKKRLCCWKLLLTVWMPTFNYSVFKSRPKDISKACLSLPTTKTHQDKPFWQLSIVTVNLPGFSDYCILKYIHSESGLPFNYWAVKSNISVLLGKLVNAKRT